MREPTNTIVKGTLAAIVIVVLFTFSSIPALASIASPDTLQIQEVLVYENCREAGDQLYLITEYIHYDTEPDESAEDLFILRLLDAGNNEIASAKPYAFYNDGYDLGVMAFYLNAASAPDYEASLTVQLTGDPLADWTSSVPVVTTDGLTWTTGEITDMRQIVSTRIVTLASMLEQAWTTEMIAVSQGTTILSDTGAAYFLRVVPYLSTVAPYAIGQYTFTPDYPEEDVTENDYEDSVVLGIIYYAAFGALLLFLVNKRKFKKGTGLLAFAGIIGFSFFGVPLTLCIIAAFIALISISYVVLKQA